MTGRWNLGAAVRACALGLGLTAGWAGALQQAWASADPVAAVQPHKGSLPDSAPLALAPNATVAAAPARLALCLSCHGADARQAQAAAPNLAAQPKVFLENTLIMIREGLRPVAAKRGLLDGISDAEVAALADHFSRQTVPGERPARDPAAFTRGQALATQGLCGTCHLPNFAGQQQMPRLAGQHESYLSHSMKRFRDNQAEGRDTMMNGVLRGLSDGAVADLAHYFSQLR